MGMMEVGLARRMPQRPICLTAARLFDECRQTETPSGIKRQARQPIQLQGGLQCVALSTRLHFDVWRADLGRVAHFASITAEPICRPLCRGRKVELVVAHARRSPHERLETSMLPELISTRTRRYGRHVQIAYFAGHKI